MSFKKIVKFLVMSLGIVYIVLVGMAGCLLAKDLPPFLHVCHKDNPEMEKCFMESIENLRPYLVKGVPEYHIPSVEPLVIKELIKEETSGITLTTNDVIAYGGSNFHVTAVKVDMSTKQFIVDIDLPELKIEARYTVQGRIVILQIKGNGNFYGNITNCKSKSILQGELYEQDGEQHLRFTSHTMSIHVGGGHVKLDNLFGGEKLLNDVVNDTVNKNLNVFLKELMPIIEKALASVFLEIANKIVKPFTFVQLFPN